MSKPQPATIEVGLTRSEINQLATWHRECETRCVEMREYEMASEHKDQGYQFTGLQKTGWYQHEASKGR